MEKESINCERLLLSSQALKIAQKEIMKLQLDCQYVYAGKEIKTYQCQLTDKKNNFIFYGCGKGIGIQSKVSATFEALEHYYCYQVLMDKRNKSIYFMSFKEVENLNEIIESGALPNNFINHKNIELSIPWLEFVSFNDSYDNKKFYYPLFLAEPRYLKYEEKFEEDKFNYEEFSGLGCDSGTASGTSFIEAAIHGLNECIERDATSLFLANTFIKKFPISLVKKSTLPQYLINYIKIIEEEFNDDLAIVDITSDIQIPTFCVAFTNQNVPIQPKGYGTSLSKSYALERALLEAIQPLHLRTDSLDQMQLTLLKNFSFYPGLQDAATADIGKLIKNNQYIEKSFITIIDPMQADINQQFEEIIKRIQIAGFIPRYNSIVMDTVGITCIKVLIPGFDNFFLVTQGKLILPGKRCRNLFL